MTLRLITLVFLSILLSSSCTGEGGFFDAEPVTVGIAAGEGETRTSMLPNGLSARWETGDEIAVWALNSSGTSALEAQKFVAYGLDSGHGFFTSTLASPMPDDIYTYYACYPFPESYDGTSATFTIPDIQDGRVSGGADLMIASLVQHGPLTPIADPDNHSGMSLQMNHMLHQFRFYIPGTESAIIADHQITRLELTFPKPVAGKVTYRLSEPSAPVSTKLDKNSIILQLQHPMAVSSELDYTCVAFAPTSFELGESLKIRAFTSDKIAVVDPVDLCARNFEPGHSTPVRLLIKEFIDYPYAITFTLDGNYVGENVWMFP